MIRSSVGFTSARLSSVIALVSLSLFAFAAVAQQAPSAPAQAPSAQAAPAQAAPAKATPAQAPPAQAAPAKAASAQTSSSPAPSAPAPTGPVFPKVDPANFTATSPTKEMVNGFLQANWGYDENRVWEVYAIQKTQVEGLSKVMVLVADKSGKQKMMPVQFFVLPGTKYIFAGDDIVPFGEHPFADDRAVLQQRADGPYRGSASKDLEMVEFADFQCPHCKEAQANIEKLTVDFPKARIVYQSLPLPQHPASANAATYGACVAKLGGSSAFFTFASAVYDGQDGLATADGATLTLNSAVTKAGLDPAKVADCTKSPEAAAAVDASKKLAQDLKINQTPTLMVNGRPVPLNMPYDTLKKVIEYQAKMDGVTK